MFLSITACNQISDSKNITKNVLLVKNNNDYQLIVRYPSKVEIVDSIIELGLKSDIVVVKGVSNSKIGWICIFDEIENVKSWGIYNDKEFKKRKNELNISDLPTKKPQDFW